MINCRKLLAKRNINRAFPRNNPPRVKAKGNCLSVPLSHLFFSLPSHNCLKYTNTILSFHRQKKYMSLHILQRCAECLYTRLTNKSCFLPSLLPTSSPNSAPLSGLQREMLLVSGFTVHSRQDCPSVGHGLRNQIGSSKRAGMLSAPGPSPWVRNWTNRPPPRPPHPRPWQRRGNRPREWLCCGQAHTASY